MIVVWAVFFIALWQILSALCWRPLLALVEAREAATVGASHRVKTLNDEAEELAHAYENEILKARMEGVRAKSAVIQDAKTKAQSHVSAAEHAAMLAGKNAAQEMTKKSAEIEKQLEAQIATLSEQAMAKMGIQ